jgi:hypothetical protein
LCRGKRALKQIQSLAFEKSPDRPAVFLSIELFLPGCASQLGRPVGAMI